MNHPKVNPDKAQPPVLIEPLADANRLRRFGAGLGALLLLAILALLPSAQAQCSQWNVSGQWMMEQSDGLTVYVTLRQSGKTVTGTATYSTTKDPEGLLAPFKGKDFVSGNGLVSGNIAGDDFFAEIRWSSTSIGVYRGKVGSQGRIEGSVYDKGASSRKMTWVSPNLMKCPENISASTSRILSGNLLQTAPKTAEPAPAATNSKRVISHKGKGPADAGAPVGAPKIGTFNQANQAPNTRTLGWDAGPEHPYAEVWVSVDGGDETKVVEQGKGTRQVSVEPGKTYRYILTDSGRELATVTVRGK